MTGSGIDWRPMTEWPPKGRKPGDQFLFWLPASANGRIVLGAEARASNAPAFGGRSVSRWARIDPPKSDAELARDRVVAAVRRLRGNHFLGTQMWGPAYATIRAEVLSLLTGAKVPKSRAGFNAFREALYAALGVDSAFGTPNARENEFARRANALLREAGDPG